MIKKHSILYINDIILSSFLIVKLTGTLTNIDNRISYLLLLFQLYFNVWFRDLKVNILISDVVSLIWYTSILCENAHFIPLDLPVVYHMGFE